MALGVMLVGAAVGGAAGHVYIGGNFHKWVQADGGEVPYTLTPKLETLNPKP